MFVATLNFVLILLIFALSVTHGQFYILECLGIGTVSHNCSSGFFFPFDKYVALVGYSNWKRHLF